MNLDDMRVLAEKGDPVAQFNMGVACAQRNAGLDDAQQTIQWWLKAAEQGYALAQYNLGRAHAEGDFVPIDGPKALKWFKRAAENNLAEAQFALGLLFHAGRLVAQDFARAVYWYQRAASQGSSQACFNLGHIFLEEGERFDPCKAYALFQIAVVLGDPRAEQRLDDLARTMTSEQVAQAKEGVQKVLGGRQVESR